MFHLTNNAPHAHDCLHGTSFSKPNAAGVAGMGTKLGYQTQFLSFYHTFACLMRQSTTMVLNKTNEIPQDTGNIGPPTESHCFKKLAQRSASGYQWLHTTSWFMAVASQKNKRTLWDQVDVKFLKEWPMTHAARQLVAAQCNAAGSWSTHSTTSSTS